MSQERPETPPEGLEAVRTPAGFNHTHVAGDFYFTPVKPGDRLMPNYHLSYEAITGVERVDDLNLVDNPQIRRAVIDGVDFNGVCEAGFLYTAEAVVNPFLHRSPAAKYSLVLKEGYAARQAPSESGQRLYLVECLFKAGDKVQVKLPAGAEGSADEPELERLEMTVDKYEAGIVYVYWLDESRVAHDAQYLPGQLERAPAAEAPAETGSAEEEATSA
jgi:hypothetical protein